MSKSVLIVQRDANLRLSLCYLMAGQGYDVSEAGDGDIAIRLVGQQPPDLVLMGVDLDKRSGFHLCQYFRADPGCRDMKIIFVTSKVRSVEQGKGLALGANAYITKPFANADLLAEVRTVLGG